MCALRMSERPPEAEDLEASELGRWIPTTFSSRSYSAIGGENP